MRDLNPLLTYGSLNLCHLAHRVALVRGEWGGYTNF